LFAVERSLALPAKRFALKRFAVEHCCCLNSGEAALYSERSERFTANVSERSTASSRE
jgi:hypothetical protein